MANEAKRVIMLGFDGADPLLLQQLLKEGKLPHIAQVIERGTTTEDMGMTGVVPTVTPPGWCTLATGSHPGTHGITCFWNHTAGQPLDQLDYGFLSPCNKSETIWEAYAKAGKTTLVVNYPTSYPPKITDHLIMVDGSMLTPMFNAVAGQEMFYECAVGDFEITAHYKEQNTSGTNCVVEGEIETKTFGVEAKEEIRDSLHEAKLQREREIDEITAKARARHGKVIRSEEENSVDQIGGGGAVNETRTPLRPAQGWGFATEGMLEAALPMNNNLKRHYILVAPDGTVAFYFSKKDQEPQARVTAGQWTPFIEDHFDVGGQMLPVAYKLKVCQVAEDRQSLTLFMTCQMNLAEDKYVFPHELLPDLYAACGPVAKVFNYGGADHSKQRVVMETWKDSHYWQAKAVRYLMERYGVDLVYTHFHIIDELEHLWIEKTVPGCCAEWEHYRQLVLETYEVMDEVVAQFLPLLEDGETAIFITSDHALLPKTPECPYQPMGDTFGMTIDWMEANGYLQTKLVDGVKAIDWPHTKATFQRSSYVYINLKGRDPEGCVAPEEYEALVDEIISKLYAYRDPVTGKRVVDACLKRDGMEQIGLWGPNCGDIFFVHNPEFARHHSNTWSATRLYDYSTKAIFLAAGAGIKQGYRLTRRVHMVDVAPTIAALQKAPLPTDCEGGAIFQMFAE